MRIGAASSPLPVPLGTPLGGYADRIDPATGTLDELEVRCLALVTPEATLILAVADLVCANEDLAAAVTQAVTGALPSGNVQVWTLATHTHSGPDQDCGAGERVTPEHWRRAVPAAAATAAARAVATAVPASCELRTGALRDVGAVRAAADASAEVPVELLSAVGADGRLRGVFAVVPVHPTVLPAASSLVSGDLSAAIRRALTARLSGDSAPWVIVATGCAGDISTRTTRREQTPAECARLGGLAAEQLEGALAGPAMITAPPDAPIAAASRTLRLPLRPDEPAPGAAAGPGAGPASDVERRIAHTLMQGAAVARERSRRFPDGVVSLTVSAARIGPLRLAGLGAEPYLAVRELPAEPTVVLGYANGYAGYLPDAEGFGRVTYESLSSPFRPEAAAIAVAAVEELFTTLNPEE